jgi:hypothetical protein
MVTIKDLTTKNGDDYYTGPLEEAKAFLKSYSNTSEVSIGGRVEVYINQDGDSVDDIPSWNNCNEFGKGTSSEEAWRFALGAAFGPADDEFSAFPMTTNHTEAVRTLVDYHFPKDKRVDVFWSTATANAVVMDEDGNLWQVFPDGTIKVYRG